MQETNQSCSAAKEIVDKLKSSPDLFLLNLQTCHNLKEYFAINYNCACVPNGFLEFLGLTDGVTINDITIFSVNKSKDNYVLLFDDFANDEVTSRYLEQINVEGKENLMFFANDGEGGRFAFNKKDGGDEVYYLSKDKPDVAVIYMSFLGWLGHIVDKALKAK